MKIVAFFNNKGGVGATTLVFHLAWMFAKFGVRVVAADLDPQANLTAVTLPFSDLEEIQANRMPTVYDLIAPAVSNDQPVEPELREVTEGFALLPGDLELSFVEDALSGAWADSLSDSPLTRRRGLRISASLARAVSDAGSRYGAQLGLIDVGPNLGAINRAALLAADFVVIPVAPDIFSLKGLSNVGKGLRAWREGWEKRCDASVAETDGWLTGAMEPVGYIVSRFTIYKNDQARHFSRWINRVPRVFHRDVLGETSPAPAAVNEDPASLAWLKDYHSLMAMAHETRKPIFELKPADGAIGGHQQAVLSAFRDFETLAEAIANRIGLVLPAKP